MGWYPYLLAAALLVVAVVISRGGPRNSLRARNITGNTIVGDVSGTASQTNTSQPEQKPDRVAWAIGIVGVMIAAATFALEHLMPK